MCVIVMVKVLNNMKYKLNKALLVLTGSVIMLDIYEKNYIFAVIISALALLIILKDD